MPEAEPSEGSSESSASPLEKSGSAPARNISRHLRRLADDEDDLSRQDSAGSDPEADQPRSTASPRDKPNPRDEQDRRDKSEPRDRSEPRRWVFFLNLVEGWQES